MWYSRLQVTLYSEGITRTSLFGEVQMGWTDVEKFYYSATKRSVNFIPIGTYYDYKLVDSRGQKLRAGSGLAGAAELGQRLIELTSGPLLEKYAARFNSGGEVVFGPIRLSRQDGIRIKRFLGEKHVPWDQVQEYRIDSGHFYVWRAGEKRTFGPSISKIPNVFVLQALLDSIFRAETQSSAAKA